jgi:hypothetical protein
MSDIASYGGGGGKGSSLNNVNPSSIIYFGRVEKIVDNTDSGNIKVRVDGVDSPDTTSGDLPNAFPLLPKHINIVPKVGELVFLLKSKSTNTLNFEQRYYLGPIISQPQFLSGDNYINAKSALSTALISLDVSPTVTPEADGIYPKQGEIAIQGRDNSDIVFKPSEVLIRAGKFVVGKPLEYNTTNPAYIQIKNNVTYKQSDNGTEKDVTGGVINVVSNKINLLTHGGVPSFPLAGRNNVIDDETLNDILKNAHPAVYGDVLIEIIKLLIEFVKSHTHNYNGLPPVLGELESKIIKFQTDSLISKNIRIS